MSCFGKYPRDILAFAGRLRTQQRAVAKEEPSRTSEHVTVQEGSKWRCRLSGLKRPRSWRERRYRKINSTF